MTKVITYGTYDLLHYGHIRLLERAKSLGDYLIVGVTSDDFDKSRGKINVQQSLGERIKALNGLGFIDEIIIEEYEGQKIDDIKKYNVDIFTVGSDWIGQFDYLNKYCEVIYLERTEGVSSSEIRATIKEINIGIIGDGDYIEKIMNEATYVDGVKITGIYTQSCEKAKEKFKEVSLITDDLDRLIEISDAIYVYSAPIERAKYSKYVLEKGRHVLCQSPVSVQIDDLKEIRHVANKNGMVFMEALKTAYSTAYNRMLLLARSGKIGSIVSVDATCTSLRDEIKSIGEGEYEGWGSFVKWGATGILPIIQLLGDNYCQTHIVSNYIDKDKKLDTFTKVDFVYKNAVASAKIATSVKSEGELIISGTKGYIYVPSPWWKNEYFEIRYEDVQNNKKYYYETDGEGTRYELVAFAKAIRKGEANFFIEEKTTNAIVQLMEEFFENDNEVQIEI